MIEGVNSIIDVGPLPFGGPTSNPFEETTLVACLFKFEPARTFTMENDEGKKAVLDFGGDTITFSGDLPVTEAAKQFFEAVIAHWKAS